MIRLNTMRNFKASTLLTYLILTLWSLLVLFPIWTMLVNSVKPQREIFRDPFGLPDSITWAGYEKVWVEGNFAVYFRNSIMVTVVSLLLILFLGSLAAFALAYWRSRFANLIYLFFIAGLMVPIRLGTINIFQTIIALNLNGTLWSLIPVYVAMGMPIAVFVLTAFIRSIPSELVEAARVDGASKWRTYLSLIMPLIRPALATVAIFNLIPIWNDLWFPLIFLRGSEEFRTVTLGVSLLFGQYQTNWTSILSTLSLSAVPLLVLYLLMSKQFIKGLTAGAVKG
jgi:raffinose/stachyose/melibiose transport system permease protein